MTMTAMIAETFDDEICPECKGKGYQTYRWAGAGPGEDVNFECDACAGTGHGLRCAVCGAKLQLVRPGKFQCLNCG